MLFFFAPSVILSPILTNHVNNYFMTVAFFEQSSSAFICAYLAFILRLVPRKISSSLDERTRGVIYTAVFVSLSHFHPLLLFFA